MAKLKLTDAFIALAFLICLLAAQNVWAAIYTVTNISDSGAGSLRQAVMDANATADADTIVFNIPAASCSANGVCTIYFDEQRNRRCQQRQFDDQRHGRESSDYFRQ